MKDVMDYISNWPVLKWVLLVLVAGFIGQFGKMLADAIMEKVRRRKAERAKENTKTPPASTLAPVDKPLSEQSSLTAGSGEMADKKQLKAFLKARKKESKNNPSGN